MHARMRARAHIHPPPHTHTRATYEDRNDLISVLEHSEKVKGLKDWLRRKGTPDTAAIVKNRSVHEFCCWS